jgi:hypothetical protein
MKAETHQAEAMRSFQCLGLPSSGIPAITVGRKPDHRSNPLVMVFRNDQLGGGPGLRRRSLLR